MAGLLPGLILAAALMAQIYFMCRPEKYSAQNEKFSLKKLTLQKREVSLFFARYYYSSVLVPVSQQQQRSVSLDAYMQLCKHHLQDILSQEPD